MAQSVSPCSSAITCWPAEKFVKELQDGDVHLCVICTGVARDAVSLSCGHIFGKVCIGTWISGETIKQKQVTCPFCREEVEPNAAATVCARSRADINRMEVYCENRAAGCLHTCILQRMCIVDPAKRLQPEHEPDCGFRLATCSHCNIVVNQLAKHFEDQECKECGDVYPSCLLSKHQHVACALGCGVLLPVTLLAKQRQQRHQEQDCSLQPVACCFSAVGCIDRIPRSRLVAHELDMPLHMRKMAGAISMLQSKNLVLENEIEQLKQIVNERIETVVVEPKIDYTAMFNVSFPNFSTLKGSQVTEITHCGGYTWRIKMYPRGVPRKQGFLALYVECMEAAKGVADVQVRVQCSLTMFNARRWNGYLREADNWTNSFTTVMNSQSSNQGWDDVASLSDVREMYLDEDMVLCAWNWE